MSYAAAVHGKLGNPLVPMAEHENGTRNTQDGLNRSFERREDGFRPQPESAEYHRLIGKVPSIARFDFAEIDSSLLKGDRGLNGITAA